jgi:hypothetical protein
MVEGPLRRDGVSRLRQDGRHLSGRIAGADGIGTARRRRADRWCAARTKVKLLFSTKSGLHIPPTTIDLSRHGTMDRIVGREDPARWGLVGLDEMWAGASAAQLRRAG